MSGVVRADATWLALREAADATARASSLVDEVRTRLPAYGTTVHDLGCGTGAMARWLGPRLTGAQHWVLHDRDGGLLPRAAADPPGRSADGAPVTVEVRRRDVTRLPPEELADADLVTASALLDVMSAVELERLLDAAAAARCPVLITLSVTGRVALSPEDPLDAAVRDAFNAHQRRPIGDGRLLGPDAVAAAVDGFTRRGHEVLLRPSPWRLGPGQAALAAAWFAGWLAAACEHEPGLGPVTRDYARRRSSEAAADRLAVTVGHLDLLAVP